jgi:hypothetical protein
MQIAHGLLNRARGLKTREYTVCSPSSQMHACACPHAQIVYILPKRKKGTNTYKLKNKNSATASRG